MSAIAGFFIGVFVGGVLGVVVIALVSANREGRSWEE
jgi:gas vesicle protein